MHLTPITATANDAAGQRFLNSFAQAMAEERRGEAQWQERMRDLGVAITHPDDGWVNDRDHTVILCYPRRLGPVVEGCLCALGDHHRWRIVRLSRPADRWLLRDQWQFTEVTP